MWNFSTQKLRENVPGKEHLVQNSIKLEQLVVSERINECKQVVVLNGGGAAVSKNYLLHSDSPLK